MCEDIEFQHSNHAVSVAISTKKREKEDTKVIFQWYQSRFYGKSHRFDFTQPCWWNDKFYGHKSANMYYSYAYYSYALRWAFGNSLQLWKEFIRTCNHHYTYKLTTFYCKVRLLNTNFVKDLDIKNIYNEKNDANDGNGNINDNDGNENNVKHVYYDSNRGSTLKQWAKNAQERNNHCVPYSGNFIAIHSRLTIIYGNRLYYIKINCVETDWNINSCLEWKVIYDIMRYNYNINLNEIAMVLIELILLFCDNIENWNLKKIIKKGSNGLILCEITPQQYFSFCVNYPLNQFTIISDQNGKMIGKGKFVEPPKNKGKKQK